MQGSQSHEYLWTPPAKETKRYQQTPWRSFVIRPRFSHKQSRTAQHTHVGHESSLPDSPGTILFPTMPNQTDNWNRSNLDLSATHLPSSWLEARIENEVIWSLLSFATGARESIAREEPTANVSVDTTYRRNHTKLINQTPRGSDPFFSGVARTRLLDCTLCPFSCHCSLPHLVHVCELKCLCKGSFA